MAEYLIQEETLNGLADKIRILSGTSDSMGTTAMGTSLDSANSEVSSQTDLISQISAICEELLYVPPMITFTFQGTTYYAEDGMTWGEFVESSYNINDAFTIVLPDYFTSAIVQYNGLNIGDTNTVYILDNDVIKDGHTYMLMV